MRRALATVGFAACAALLVSIAPARAQAPPPATNKVAAEALFEDGRRLVAAGSFAEACPKFADSQRLDPSPGTLLNLASCYEKLGRSATAWATYREAASAANAAGRGEYLATAQRHAEALAPTLARVTVTVAEPMEGLQVLRDGVRVERAEWGAPIPIDPGTHSIEASAAGHKGWTSAFEVPKDGAQVSVSVPQFPQFMVRVAPTAQTPSPVPVPWVHWQRPEQLSVSVPPNPQETRWVWFGAHTPSAVHVPDSHW
jgi:hypothetical protein